MSWLQVGFKGSKEVRFLSCVLLDICVYPFSLDLWRYKQALTCKS